MLTTTIAQGKKLLELGLDSNTADMCYLSQTPQGDPVYFKRPAVKGDDTEQYYKTSFPCWSLSALMDLLPSQFDLPSKFGEVFTYYINIRKYKLTDDVDLHQIAYGNYGGSGFTWSDMINTGEYETLFEAAYSMLVWLLENKIINN